MKLPVDERSILELIFIVTYANHYLIVVGGGDL